MCSTYKQAYNHMTRCITFFIITVLLFTVAEGRSFLSSTSPDSVPHEPVSSSRKTPSLELTQLNDDDDSCKGLDSTECVVKTTMVAHTDYIYTQEIKGP
ncbi:Phytosulfokine [Sesbania bispinosa]|nr:Phytosulfokine [Sesbania bispinosa]